MKKGNLYGLHLISPEMETESYVIDEGAELINKLSPVGANA